MQPFYQGKIDNFCALYAALNAVQLLHPFSPGQARNVFNLFMFNASRDQTRFWDILTHRTDYTREVDEILDMLAQAYPIKIEKPFRAGTSGKDMWQAISEQARPEEGRTLVFRFMRFKALSNKPQVDHWSTGWNMDAGGLHLFDCSLEESGLYYLRPEHLKQEPGLRPSDYFIIPPECVRFVSRI